MYNKFKNYALASLILIIFLPTLSPNLASANTPNSFTGLFFMFVLTCVLSFLAAMVLFFTERKFKRLDIFDILLFLPVIVWVGVFLLAVVFNIDVTKLF
jgi:hypothetical protein